MILKVTLLLTATTIVYLALRGWKRQSKQWPRQLAVRFGDRTLTFPLSWAGVTLGQYLRFVGQDLTIEHVLRTLASDEAALLAIPDPTAGVQIVNRLPFITTEIAIDTLPIPTRLTINERTVKVPHNIGLETFGQKLAVDSALKDLREAGTDINPTNAATAVLSIYLYPVLSGQPFKPDSVDDVLPDVLNLPVTDALPLAAFF